MNENSYQIDDQVDPNPSSFYGIITEDVLSSKKISSECKLLYIKLTMMTRSKGYAWPSNKFLADYFDVDESTIKRWLRELKENNYIYVEIEKKGMKTYRRIYTNSNSQNIHTRGKNELVEGSSIDELVDGSNLPPSKAQICPPTNINSNTNIKSKFVVDDPPSSLNATSEVSPLLKISYIDRDKKEVSLDPSIFMSKVLKQRVDWNIQEMQYAWQILGSYGGIVYDWWKFISGTIQKLRDKALSNKITKGKNTCHKKTTNKQECKNMLETHLDKTQQKPVCPRYLGPSALEIITGISKSG